MSDGVFDGGVFDSGVFDSGNDLPEFQFHARVEMDFGSGWVDVSEDVVSPVTAAWGIHGSSPKQRVADPGTLKFQLDNSSQNSGGLLGYYSPGHPNVRAGFDIRTPVRYVLAHDSLADDSLGEKVRWVGTVETVKTIAGLRQVADVSCADWLEDAARTKLRGVAVQVDVQSDALFETLVASASHQPPNGTLVGTGSDTYAYALDDVQDEKTSLLEVLQRLMLSEYGICHVSAGVAVFEGRLGRAGGVSVSFDLSEDDQIVGLSLASGRDDVINRVQVVAHPRLRDAAATTVLFTLGAAVEIQAGTSITINCPYRDPSQKAQRVGGVDMVAPVSGTDYSFTANEDGSGADYAAQLTVGYVGSPGGNSATVIVTNAGPNNGWIPANGLQLRGRGLYNFDPVISEINDAISIAAFGEGFLSYDMPFNGSVEIANDLATLIMALSRDPRPRARTVSFLANWSFAELQQAFGLEISDQVAITSEAGGLATEPYFVNGFQFVSQLNGLTHVTLDLSPVALETYWQLEVTGRTELDETTTLFL